MGKRKILNNLLSTLTEEVLGENSAEFWHNFYSLKVTTLEVANAFLPTTVTTLLADQQTNLRALVTAAVECLQTACEGGAEAAVKAATAVKVLTVLLAYPEVKTELADLWWDETASNLLRFVMRLALVPSYVIRHTESVEDPAQIYPSLLWYPCKTKKLLEERKVDLLRLVFVCADDRLYSSQPSPWQWLVTAHAVQFSRHFARCLFSCMHAYNAAGKWNLPYINYFQGHQQEQITRLALQIVCISLMSNVPPTEAVQANPQLQRITELFEPEGLKSNVYLEVLRSLSTEELKNLLQEAVKKVTALVIAQNTYLPKSQKPLACAAELFTFIWLCTELREGTLECLVEAGSPHALAAPLLVMLHSHSNDPNYAGVSFICSNLLNKLTLSGAFVQNLNSETRVTYPHLLPSLPETDADLLVLSIANLFCDQPKRLDELPAHGLLITLRNVAPCLTRLCNDSVFSFLMLFQKVAEQLFAEARPPLKTAMFYLLEFCSLLIKYQWNTAKPILFQLFKICHVLEGIARVFEQASNTQEEPLNPAATLLMTFETIKERAASAGNNVEALRQALEAPVAVSAEGPEFRAFSSPLSYATYGWIEASIWGLFCIQQPTLYFDYSKTVLFQVSQNSS